MNKSFTKLSSNRIPFPIRRALICLLCFLLGATATTPAWSIEPPPPAEPSEGAGELVFPADESGSLAFPDAAPNVIKGRLQQDPEKVDFVRGIDGRIGFIGLSAFGRSESIAPFELFPYIQSENLILFGDFRGFLDMHHRVGVNAGVGLRFIDPTETALFGVNGFYDVDDTSGRTYQQMSVGWEARLERAGLFGNVYMPIGDTEKSLGQTIINERFFNNNILFDVQNRVGKAMTGLDLNFEVFLPGEFFEEHQVTALAGWYHFQGDGIADDINGFKLQLQGYVIREIGTLASVTHDDTYGAKFNIGVFWEFGSRKLPGPSLYGQLRRFVDRNYNVILARKNNYTRDVVARKADGSAIIVHHIDSNATGGTGAFDDPFSSITDAQNAATQADILFVHSGSSLSETVVLGDGQALIGEGASVRMTDARYGSFFVPGRASTGIVTPEIRNSIGDAIFMGDNSLVSGINIVNAGGRGIVATNAENIRISNVRIENSAGDAIVLDGVSGGSVSDVSISGSGGNGISILNIDDVLDLNNIYVENVQGNGVHIDGGLGQINFRDDLVIKNTVGAALRIENLEQLVEVDDKGTTTTTDDETTITPATVSIEKLVVQNAGGGFGAGVSTNNNEGLILLGEVDIETEGAAGVDSRDDYGLYIGKGKVSSKDAPALDIEGSHTNINLTSLFADGGTYGIRVVDSTGFVAIYGNGTNTSSGGEIKNTDVAIYMENAGSVGVQTLDFTGNGKIAEVDTAEALHIVGSKVTGTTDMLIDARNLTNLQVRQSSFENNPISSGTGIRYVVDKTGTFSVSVSNNLAVLFPGTFMSVESEAGAETSSLTLAFQQNAVEIDQAGARALDVNWNGPLVAYATQNTIGGSGIGQTALKFVTGAGSSSSVIQASGNLIQLTGVNSTGIDIFTGSTATVFADSNEINMNGSNQTAMKFFFGKKAAVGIAGNKITDNAGGGTGLLFTSIHDNSQIAIEANTIDLSKFSTFVDRGIVVSAFTTDDSDDPLVTFLSGISNSILGASTPVDMPAVGARGRLLINDSAVTFP